MIDRILGWFSPHICKGCKVIGSILCNRCKNHIIDQKWHKCVHCAIVIDDSSLTSRGNLCQGCPRKLPFSKIFVVGERVKVLKRLVGDHKYFSEREAAKPIAELLSAVLPKDLPPDMVIVPLPTIPKHIRERGFDHTKLAARRLSQIRKIPINTNVLCRIDNISQHSATPAQRQKQAEKSFSVNTRVKIPSRILLVDDIYTTGATTIAAAKLLLRHGAEEIWLGIVARQTKDSMKN